MPGESTDAMDDTTVGGDDDDDDDDDGDSTDTGEMIPCQGANRCVAECARRMNRTDRAPAGDESCPDGYPNRELFHESIDDTRDCSTCTCGDPSGSCTEPGMTLSLWTSFGNSAELTTVDAPNDYCQSLDTNCLPPPRRLHPVDGHCGGDLRPRHLRRR